MSDRPIRCCVVIQTPRDAQSAVYIGYQSLASALETLGHSVRIVCPGDFRILEKLGGRWVPLVYRGVPRALVMFHGVEPLYHRELRAETEGAGGRLSRRYRFLQETVMPLFLRTACRHAAGVACLNRAESDYLVSQRWVAGSRVHLLAHGVPPEFFVQGRAPRLIRSLLFVGQWLPMKGTRYLRDAATTLLAKDSELRLVCAGTLMTGEMVKADFPESLRERITVLPRVDQLTLAELYREADVFVFPSLYEGFSRAIVEAMASRLPIVCTDVGVASEALRHEHSALIVPKRDAGALVDAVRRIQSDSVLARRLADAAADAAREYSLAAVSQRTIGVILDTARSRP
jgi:glycosyltransferase involved in cell wall biosynthesis